MKQSTMVISLAIALLSPCITCKEAHSAEPGSAVMKQAPLESGDGILTVVPSNKQAIPHRIAAISANGRYEATISSEQTEHIVVSEFDTGKVLLEGNPTYVRSAAISPDGRWLYVSSTGLGGQLWHIPTKTVVAADRSWPVYARDIQFSPDSARLAIADNNTIVVLDSKMGRMIGQFQIGEGRNAPYANRLVFSPDGRKLFAFVGNGDIYRLDADTLQPIGEPWLGIGVFNMAFSADSRRFAATRRLHNTMQVVVIGAVSGLLLSSPASVHGNDDQLQAVTFTPDGRFLLTASMRGMVTLWESATGEMIAQKSLSQPYLVNLRFDRDAKRLYSLEHGISWDISIRPTVSQRRDASGLTAQVVLPTGSNYRNIAEAEIATESAVFHPGSGLLIIGGGSKLNFIDGDKIRSTAIDIEPDPNPQSNVSQASVSTVAISRDGRRATAGPDYAAIGVYDVTTGKLVSIVSDSVEYANMYGRSHTFLPDGKLVVPWLHGIRIVDAEKGTTLRRIESKLDGIVSVLAAGTSKPWLAVGSSKGSLQLIRTDTSRFARVIDHIHKGAILTVAFSPDDQTIATGGADGSIRLFETQTGNPIGTTWAAHVDGVTALSFSSNGKYVASGSTDGTVRVWNVTTGKPVTYALVGHAEPVLAVMFDKSTGQLLSFGHDSILRRWNVPTSNTHTQ